MTTQEDHETLTNLGLTKLQAEVYLTLTKIGKAPVKTISDTAKIDRAHVYQVIIKLQEIGLVQKILATPNLFNALSLQEGMQILLERKKTEFSEIEEKTKETIQKIKENKPENSPIDEFQFTLTQGNDTNFYVFNKLFENTQISYDGFFICQDDFCSMTLRDGRDGIVRKLLDRGVKFRLIVCNPENKKVPKEVSKIVRRLNKNGTYNIRYTKACAAAMYGIIDGKEIYMHVGSATEWREKPSLQSNNPCLVAMAQGYFEQMWQISTENEP